MTKKEKCNYDFMAHFYDIIFGPLLGGIRKQVIAISNIETHTSILEVACGTGEQALLYAKGGATVTGLDLSEAMLKVARKKSTDYTKSLGFTQGDATDLPYADNQFDISTMTLALHEMNPSIRSQVVNEMARVTKRDGRIIIADYTVPKSKNVLSSLCKHVIWAVERIVGGEHYKNYNHFMEKGGLHSLIKKNDFRIEEESIVYSANLSVLKLLNE